MNTKNNFKHMSKSVLIRHAYKHVKDGEGNIIPLFTTKKVIVLSVKRYFNCIHKTHSLSPASRNLLDYLTETMNSENEIGNNAFFKMEFIAFIFKTCGIKYSDNTINKGFQELKKADILISFAKRKSVYTVNPLYFFKGTEAKRTKLLQKMLNASPDGKHLDTNLSSALNVKVEEKGLSS